MATKTECIKRGLLRMGYTETEHISRRKCFTREKLCKDGQVRTHYVFLMTGTLRGGFDSRFTHAYALPKTAEDAFLAGKATI